MVTSAMGVTFQPDRVSRRRRNPVIVRVPVPALVGDVQKRPVERSRSSRARGTADERSQTPGFEQRITLIQPLDRGAE
jgi:hypothetical protein